MSNEPQCEGCGQRPEVYGSSWCSTCDSTLTEYVKRRLITMRNALLVCSGIGLPPHRNTTIQTMREHARAALRRGSDQ